MKSGKLWMLVAVILAGSVSVLAQSNVDEEQGMKPYDAWHGGDLDSISMTNGALTLHIPLLGYPQRGNLNLSFTAYSNTKQWALATTNCQDPGTGPICTYQWRPQPRGGLMGTVGQPVIDAVYVASSVDYWLQNYCNIDESVYQGGQSIYAWFYGIVAPDGNGHSLGGEDSLGCPNFPLRTLDASGILQTDANTVVMPNGTRYSYQGGRSVATQSFAPSSVTDSNGNQITISSAGDFTDTLGRVVPNPYGTASDISTCPAGSSSARAWSVPGLAGATRTFKSCYSTVSVYSSFGDGYDYPPTGMALLTAIVLPDLTMWTFAYDHWGDVTRLGFPTGGSISYEYAIAGLSLVTTSRTVDANDGTGGHRWTYSYTSASNPSTLTVVVTSPDGNDTVHTGAQPLAGVGASFYEKQVQYYQGSRNGGTLLKTASTQYSAIASPFDGNAVNVVPAQVTTTMGGHTSKVVNTWDTGNSETVLSTAVPITFGSLLQSDQYDFSNTLVRSTFKHYLWQDNATYKTNNLISLPVSTSLKDGAGCEVSKTSLGYDETYNSVTLQPSLVTTHLVAAPWSVRGNHTSSNGWLISGCAEQSSITSHTIPYDTGLPYQSYDPLTHPTQYTYSSTFAGAYMTQTNMPDTQMPDAGAPVVHHVVSGNYDFNTGLLTSFTDENSQPYTYTYDNMLRLTQGNHPDGGITKFFYPDPNTVERQRLITGSTYDDYKVKFDGVGRPYQTQQLTPDCTSYIKVDTTYDVAGRAKTVSNPYCLTNEPTYGITQSDYDAMSRTTKTTKQDGSFSRVIYDSAPSDGAGASSMICTTALDETGRPRQVCSDAQGRMVKVIEPNAGSAGTNAIGWVTVNGSEQTGNSQPATSGQATISISGTEQSAQVNCFHNHCTTIWDTGTVTITVSGFAAKTVNYGQGDTPATVAWKLSCAFHNDAASAADAACPGSAGTSTQVILTARAVGSMSNYAFTTSSATSDTTNTNFSSASFTAAPASGAFSGGQNASSTPDTGTVSVTVNGTVYSTAFGTGDTSSTIAGRLATAINGGTWINATSSAGTINLIGRNGTAPEYSLSSAYTWNNAQFTNPSFTTATSGAALSGTMLLNNTPYVTTYQYNTRGEMLCVHQKGTDTSADVACTSATPPTVPAAWRQRFFTYDSFSRLLTAMNPETNSTGSTKITYNYDNDSNLTSKVEPAPNQAWGSSATVTVNYTYDALHRLLDTTYSDGATLKASQRYDYSSFQGQTMAYPIGRAVAAITVDGSNNTISSNFASYDQMGRVASTVQCNPGVTGCKTSTANYDKLGDLTSLGYPNNSFTVTYGYDSAARLTSATDSSGVVYAQNPTILASGAMQEFTSPNFNNLKYHTTYNNRLQPTEIWTGTSAGAGALFDKQYQYNPPSTSQMNSGNIYTVTNVKDSTRTQAFAYDTLNRLSTAGDNGHWANSYVYDPWGNLLQKNPGSPAGENMVKIADSNNHLSGLTYDAAGNVTNDGLGGTFVYDGENRITTTAGVTYTYDAGGRRIKKSSGTNYWHGPGGAVLAETDANGNWTNYIFFGGQRLARNVPQPSPTPADIKYYITDHLHSTAMFVDKAGTTAAILDDNDFYPWGGAVPGVGVSSSNNHYKFTGKERDTESNLDYFGARYYANVTGRFMSPDWAAKPTSVPYAEFGDPQSLNLYSYVRNSPIVRVDANGHNVAGWDGAYADTSGNFNAEALVMGTSVSSLSTSNSKAGNNVAAARGVFNTAAGASQIQDAVQSLPAAMPPPAPEPIAQQLGYTTISGGQGSKFWQRSWQLSKPSIAGGQVVQQITVRDTAGMVAIEYWEAWPVEPNSQITTPGIDQFSPGGPNAGLGYATTAQARFYEGLTQDALEHTYGFTAKNMDTMAGTLYSTKSDPHIPIDHASNNVVVTWTIPQ